MKRTIISLACALIAPLAFAQTSSTTTSETTSTSPSSGTSTTTSETTTTSTSGTVTTYTPGKTIVVRSSEGPVTFALGTTANIVDATGKVVKIGRASCRE